jgi:hypothetical protein
MCSNFGLNLHPGRKPCALQWQWYNFFTSLYGKLRRRFFPKALYTHEGPFEFRPPERGGDVRPPKIGGSR